jgi:hypothetical protein
MISASLIFVGIILSVVLLRLYLERKEHFMTCPAKSSSIGLMPYEKAVFDKAPFLSYVIENQSSVSTVVEWAEMKMEKLSGPIFLVIGYGSSSGLKAYLMAPNHLKTGALTPNHHATGINHRWMSRFAYNNFKYSMGDPNNSRCPTALPGCNMKECGCIGSGCNSVPRYQNEKLKRAQVTDFWAVYDMRPSVRLARNILPAGIDMKQGDENALVSNNGAYKMVLDGSGLSVNGTTIVAGSGADHVILEDPALVLYSKEDKALTSSKVVAGGEGPYALALEDDGNIRVYDRYNKPATAPDVAKMTAAVPKSLPGVVEASADVPFDEEWTPERDFAARLQNLLDYLTVRGLLKEYHGSAASGIENVGTGTMFSVGDMQEFEKYNPDEDYSYRISQLEAIYGTR